jgi:hypothetical protein
VRHGLPGRGVGCDFQQEHLMFRMYFAAALAASCAFTTAQESSSGQAKVEYRSSFEDYRPWSAEPLRDWRAVNDEVERLGGHAGHLRSSAVGERKPEASATPPQQRDLHGDHGR